MTKCYLKDASDPPRGRANKRGRNTPANEAPEPSADREEDPAPNTGENPGTSPSTGHEPQSVTSASPQTQPTDTTASQPRTIEELKEIIDRDITELVTKWLTLPLDQPYDARYD
ncbi:hypothetical protein N7533_008430 [Penicillium manginii]|jgi:hypothetical protein|uniref:uncharacterized protein n=1 Tax=Penicillium manginii TaxID=203109 RepID=UPI0025471A3E|nr:uncharacterized protein N7533_008430 [Penicillium manginii]KAJ5743560.1 hypothetical protein N7533_008430 [Penicillium manginii]